MLRQLGRLKRTRSLLVIGFAVLLAVSLVFFYAPGRTARYVEPTKSTEVVAKVGSDEITVADLALLRESYRQWFGGQINLAQLGGYRRLLDGLIRGRVISQEATRLGLAASDAEVAEKIRKQYTDASGQFVGLERYRQAVVSQYGDIEKFERGVRNDIALEKLKAFVTAGVIVSDEEVQEDYKRDNTTFDLAYLTLTADKLAQRIQVSDEDLRTHYEQNKEQYRIHDPQKKVRYIYIDQSRAGSKLQIPDSDLREEYEKLAPEFKQAGVRVQQILLKVARADLDAQVEQKAKDLVAKARAATGQDGEKVFGELARGNSEDPATARNNGFLPAPVRKNPNRADALYDRTLDMQPGDITEPIRHGGNLYVLRRGESVPKTFEQAKPELLVSLRNRRSYSVAADLAERAQSRLQETKDPQKVAQEFAAEANMSPGEMVKETSYIIPGDDVPGIGSNQQFEQAIATLNEPNDVGEPTGVRGGFAIPMLVDKREPRSAEFEEVKTKVADALKQRRATEQLEQKAKEIASSAQSASNLTSVAEREGFKTETDEAHKLGSALGSAGASPALDEAIYALKNGEVTQTPIKVGDNWVIVGVTKRTEADLTQFAAEREQLTRSLINERRNQVFEDYISAVLEKMRQEGRIRVYNEVIARLELDEPAATSPMPRFPIPTE